MCHLMNLVIMLAGDHVNRELNPQDPWEWKPVYKALGIPINRGQKIPKDMSNQIDYRGCIVTLRRSDEVDPIRSLHRITVECPCGKIVGLGRMGQHARACRAARETRNDRGQAEFDLTPDEIGRVEDRLTDPEIERVADFHQSSANNLRLALLLCEIIETEISSFNKDEEILEICFIKASQRVSSLLDPGKVVIIHEIPKYDFPNIRQQVLFRIEATLFPGDNGLFSGVNLYPLFHDYESMVIPWTP
jgi:hypothetical protein